MPQTPTLRGNHLEIFLAIKKIVTLYEQPRGPFLEPLPGLVFCPGFQLQLWAWSNSNKWRGSKKKSSLSVTAVSDSQVCFWQLKDTTLQKRV